MHSEKANTAAPDAGITSDSTASGEPFVRAKFGGVLMVCGDCQQRSSGPTKHSAKDWRSELKKAVGHQPPRWRVVECSCLGLCPRKATAVAAAGTGAPVRLAALRRKADLKAFAAGLATGE